MSIVAPKLPRNLSNASQSQLAPDPYRNLVDLLQQFAIL